MIKPGVYVQALLPLHAALLHSAVLAAYGMLVFFFHVAIARHPLCTRGPIGVILGRFSIRRPQFIVYYTISKPRMSDLALLNASGSSLLKLLRERHTSRSFSRGSAVLYSVS